MSKSNLYHRALSAIPGGVNSPVRAFGSVKMEPVFIKKGRGEFLYDENNRRYIDFVLSWGAMIFGHAHPDINRAAIGAARRGSSFGLPTGNEVRLAELIKELIPSIEKFRMTCSGTEGVMSAVRLSRAYTGRSKIIKFDGCYHGHSDAVLVKSGSGLLTTGIIDSNGVTRSVTSDTITLPYNNIQKLKDTFSTCGNEIAAVIVEPVAVNMGTVLPDPGFLKALRELTTANRALLIFDEVITGFRIGAGGAQGHYCIKPDLTVLGKIIGGGYPAGGFGGRADIMDNIAPSGNVYHAGTFAGNPVTVAAGVKMLEMIKSDKTLYSRLGAMTSEITGKLGDVIKRSGKEITVNGINSLFTVFFTGTKVTDLESALKSDTSKFAGYFSHCLSRGIMLPPSQFEGCFLSAKHRASDIKQFIRAACEFIES